MRFFGISAPQESDPDWSKTRAAIRENGLPYPTLVDADRSVARRFGVEGLPHTVVIDRQGIVRAETTGSRGEAELREALRKAGALGGP